MCHCDPSESLYKLFFAHGLQLNKYSVVEEHFLLVTKGEQNCISCRYIIIEWRGPRIPKSDVAVRPQRPCPGVSTPSCGAQGKKASIRLLQLCVHPSVLESGLKQLSSRMLARRWPKRRESATQASAVPPHIERRWPAYRAASKSRPHRQRRSVTTPPSKQRADPPRPALDKPFAISVLPFANHIRRLALPSSATRDELESVLAQAFVELLDLCISTVRHAAAKGDLDEEGAGGGGLSYNVVLTLGHLYVFPRRRESHRLAVSGEMLSVNALGFAGFLLVKSEAELCAVTAEGPTNVLKAVACASVHDLQVGGGPEFDGDVV